MVIHPVPINHGKISQPSGVEVRGEVESDMDIAELARVRSALADAETRLREKDEELRALRRELMLVGRDGNAER